MAAAPKRETAATRGYTRAEMDAITKAAEEYAGNWCERFRAYMDMLAHSEYTPVDAAARARELVEAEEAVIRERFGSV